MTRDGAPGDAGGGDDDAPYRAGSFEAFWPYYVRLHARPETQLAHAVATTSALALGALAVAHASPLLLLLAPLVDFGIAQASHRLVERNRTRPWRHPLWHARAELRMYRLVLTGRMAAETARHHGRAR